MRVGKGIPLPQNIESSGLTCVQLYIPTDDEGMYIQALAGAYSQMGKWNYWQKDGTNRGAQVAEIWREAIDKTYEEAWLSGVFMTCTQVQDLVDAINGIRAEMTVSNRNLVNAIRALELTTAPINCIPCGERVEVPPTPTPDPDPQNPPVGNNPSEWNAHLCRATNYLWYEHVMRGGVEMVFLASTGQTIIGVGAVIAILYASGIGAPIAFGATILATVLAIASTWDRTTFEAELERLAEPMICAITSSSGTESALQAMRDTLVEEGADQDTIDYVMSVTGTNAMNKLFNGEIVVPDEFIAPVDCSGCGASGNVIYDFEDGEQGWDLSSRVSWNLLTRRIVHHPKNNNPPDPTVMRIQRTDIADRLGVSDQPFTLQSMVLDFLEDPDMPGFSNARYCHVNIYFEDGTSWASPAQNFESVGHSLSGWDTAKELRSTAGGAYCIDIRAYSGGSGSNGQINIDNIVLDVA